MWPFKKRSEKEELLDLKKITVGGIKFEIKKINPFLDFPTDKMPQIFTELAEKYQKNKDASVSEQEMMSIDSNIKPILEAGIYRPIFEPLGQGEQRGKEKGLTIQDLFIDREIAYKLFGEIMEHSLNRFKGLARLFFSLRIRLLRFTQ